MNVDIQGTPLIKSTVQSVFIDCHGEYRLPIATVVFPAAIIDCEKKFNNFISANERSLPNGRLMVCQRAASTEAPELL